MLRIYREEPLAEPDDLVDLDAASRLALTILLELNRTTQLNPPPSSFDERAAYLRTRYDTKRTLNVGKLTLAGEKIG